ncbi:DinB family protein [Microlunatus soli]|uniref:Pentapeptide repeat-containing protein n=1 Tax=Microlunatus soli TaxID=630515 RepID=A0A1H1U9E2_9ACTN|nr:DinB family protein [Microlunatus soli]SDS69007.1 Pentapeptide repeat-containing protein [Microlunatus soli]
MVRFDDEDLSGATFRETDLRGIRMRGVRLSDADLDGQIDGLVVNGVEVLPLIEAELDRRHPERAVLRAHNPEQFRTGWAGLEHMWATTHERVERMPPGTVDISVDEEWSFADTLRHLVFATDTWLGWAIQDRRDAYHPIGLAFVPWRDQSPTVGIDLEAAPTWTETLEVRLGRVAMVRDFLATVEPDDLGRPCTPPPFAEGRDGEWRPTLRECLGVIMNEEWHHHRFAVRDLNIIDTS